MIIVDPLRLKVAKLLDEGHAQPIAAARVQYGLPADYADLQAAVASQPEILAPTIIDFTPMERLGRRDVVGQFLESLDRRCTFLSLSNDVSAELVEAGVALRHQCAVYAESGEFLPSNNDNGRPGGQLAATRELLRTAGNLYRIREYAAERKLLSLLGEDGVVYPYDPEFLDHPMEWCDGTPYLRMNNEMLVSCFIHLKRALRRPDRLIDLAYSIALALDHYFVGSVSASERPELLVVPNNTALFVASAVQLLTGMPISVIDRLGPIPSKRLTSINTSLPVESRRVAVLVEVSATGGEVDRTIQYLSGVGARIVRLICCYNLDVGRPLLREKVPFVNLCNPKQAVGYVYRSHYHVSH